MNDIIRARWIKELRTTKLAQAPIETEAILIRADTQGEPDGVYAYDPVGLLGNLYIQNTKDATVFKVSQHSNEMFVNHRHPGLLKWAGITGDFGEDRDLLNAIQLHDAGKTFREIADGLERG